MSIATLNPALPDGLDPVTFGDDEIRALKLSLKQSFPAFSDDPVDVTIEQMCEAYNKHNDIGVIRLFAGTVSEIPDGYAVCDGSSYTDILGNNKTTPNLTEYVIAAGDGNEQFTLIGDEEVAITDTGHALTTDEIPAHNHTVDEPWDGDHDNGGSSHAPEGDNTETATSEPAGGGEKHYHSTSISGVKPLYYTRIFIMWVGADNRAPIPVDGIETLDPLVPDPEDHVEFGDDDLRDFKTRLQATFADFTGVPVVLTEDDFTEAYTNTNDIDTICMWHSTVATIPTGWEHVPELDGYYTMLTDDFSMIGTTTGSNSATPVETGSGTNLSPDHMPEHSHEAPFINATNHDGDGQNLSEQDDLLDNGPTTRTMTDVGEDLSHTHTYEAVDIQPMRVVVPFIRWIGLTI